MYLSHLTILRGLAILFILLFHLNSQIFPNGYLGVEAFLVISGFLLFRSFDEKGAPTLREFIEKKLIRILPPLAVSVLLACLASLFFVYDDGELRTIYRTACHALLGKSNLFLSGEKGYFATDTANNALMHTWYIGVTLQLYLIYIIPAALIGKFSKKAAGVLFACIGCASLGYAGLCISGILPGQESSLYYSTPARIWEAFSGAVVLFIPTTKLLQGRKKEILTCITVACMTLLALCPVQLPMYAAAPAMVICSIVFIAYAGDSCILKTTMLKPLILLGDISFSLYLVHYPLIVFFKNWNEGSLSWSGALLCLAVIFIIAYLFCVLVEKRKMGPCLALLIWGTVFACVLLGVKNNSLRNYFPNRLAAYPAYSERPIPVADTYYQKFDKSVMPYSNGVFSILGLYSKYGPTDSMWHIGDPHATPSFVVIGDSNAEHLFAGLDTVCRKEHCAGIHINSIMFPFWGRESGNTSSYFCGEEKLKSFLSWLEAHPELRTVVIGQFWPCRFDGSWHFKDWQGNDATGAEKTAVALKDFCYHLHELHRDVLLVGPMPRLSYKKTFSERRVLVHKRLSIQKNKELDFDGYSQSLNEYREINKVILPVLEQLEREGACHVLHTQKAIFRDGDSFCAYDRKTREQYLRDATHLTPAGCIMIMQQLEEELTPWLKPAE